QPTGLLADRIGRNLGSHHSLKELTDILAKSVFLLPHHLEGIDSRVLDDGAAHDAKLPLEKIGRQLGQRAALPLGQSNMAGDLLALEAIYDVHQAVVGGIDVRIVDLKWIAGENDFRVVPYPGDDCLDLVRGQILRFVHDDELVGDTSPADV